MPFTGLGINETPDVAPAVLEARLRRLVELGHEAVEIRLHHVGAPAGAEPLVLGGRLNTGRTRELVATLDRVPLRRTLHASTIFTPNPALRAAGLAVADAMVELAQALDAEVVVVHPGSLPEGATPAEVGSQQTEERAVVGAMAARLAGRGTRVALENMIALGSFASDPWALRAHIEAIHADGHANVGVCLDVGHMGLSAAARGFDYADGVAVLAPHVVHTHMSDNFARPGSTAGLSPLEQMRFGIGDLHLPIGWGVLPHDHVFPSLAFPRRPLFLYELNQSLRGSLADGVEEAMVATARRLMAANEAAAVVAAR
jgi:sugar phosphate isomerase/epimerase